METDIFMTRLANWVKHGSRGVEKVKMKNTGEVMTSWFFEYLYLQISMYQDTSITSQPAITCSKLTTETLDQGVKYFQS